LVERFCLCALRYCTVSTTVVVLEMEVTPLFDSAVMVML
jgi:hypothetical protein